MKADKREKSKLQNLDETWRWTEGKMGASELNSTEGNNGY